MQRSIPLSRHFFGTIHVADDLRISGKASAPDSGFPLLLRRFERQRSRRARPRETLGGLGARSSPRPFK
jgi:hypothetical protein